VRVPALAAALALALVAGCGDDSTSANTLTAAEWRREANALCRELGRRIRAVPRPPMEDRILDFTAAVTPLWKREEDELRALVPPPELATRAEELADALAQVNVGLLEIHIATERNDGDRRNEGIERSEGAGREVKQRSQDLGLSACAAQRIP
jgi:hypothetical protein